jgi:CDP-ribitol ribitolphosphotransferase
MALAVRRWAIALAWYVARLLPLRRRVILASAHRAHLDGNLAAIAAELRSRNPPVPHKVVAYRERHGWRGALRTLVNEMVAAYYVATSRLFIVEHHFFPLHVVAARPGSITVQTWHACGAFKKFGLSRPDRQASISRGDRELAEGHRNFSLFLASSKFTAECYAEAFGQPLEKFVWKLGIPRTDVLIAAEPAQLESIRARVGIPAGKKVILYAPTYRGSSSSVRSPDNLDLPMLQRQLGEDHVLLLRLHPKVAAGDVDPRLAGFVIDVSAYPEMNELMLVSDVMVTDYSSVIFEFSLLDRPTFLFAPDHAEYEGERGFYFDYVNEGPGPLFETTAALGDHLRAGSFDLDTVRRFRQRWFEIADGHSSERFVDQIVLPALAGRPPS